MNVTGWANTKNISHGTDAPAWIDRYCSNHSSNTVVDAALAFALELATGHSAE
jgi:hypothetical protein